MADILTDPIDQSDHQTTTRYARGGLPGWIGRGPWPAAAAAMFAVLAYVVAEYTFHTGPVTISLWYLLILLGTYAVLLLSLLLAAPLAGVGRNPGPFVGLGFLAIGLSTLFQVAVFRLLEGPAAYWLAGAAAPMLVLGVAVLLARGCWWLRGLRSLLATALVVAPVTGLSYSVGSIEVWETSVPEDARADAPVLYTEDLYAAQPDLMAAQIEPLATGVTGEVEMFAVLAGGTADQSVFASEVDAVGRLLEQQFDAGGRLVQLANSQTAPYALPMASRTNLAAALSAVGERMNRDEDFAFIFLTSHGWTDRFSLSFWQAGLRDLSAEDLARMLDEAGIARAVIVVSACYSGSFIDELAGPERLVITASAADRNSFGCVDGVDWTWWGRAFFDEALRADRDFRRAFDRAAGQVAQWEAAEGYIPSQPQMSQGASIAGTLDAYFSTDAGRD